MNQLGQASPACDLPGQSGKESQAGSLCYAANRTEIAGEYSLP